MTDINDILTTAPRNEKLNEILARVGDYPKWINPNRVALLCTAGSHAYGTNTPTSDEDFRGIVVAPNEFRLGFSTVFEEYHSNKVDLVLFEMRKFFKLAADCNPNIIELLFTDRSDMLHVSLAGEILIANRDLFLSKKARHTFAGYALGQLKRINTHHRWLSNPPTVEPTRAGHGLPEMTLIPKDQLGAAETAIKKKMESWELAVDGLSEADKINLTNRVASYLAELQISKDFEWETAARNIGYDDNFLELLRRERAYRTAKNEWDSYQNWCKSRNAARAELERQHGYDTKHAMHLVRLLRMCEEILSGQGVIVKRPDAKELLEIRNGSWSYDKIIAWADEQDKKMNALYETSTLPRSSDVNRLEQLCVDIAKTIG